MLSAPPATPAQPRRRSWTPSSDAWPRANLIGLAATALFGAMAQSPSVDAATVRAELLTPAPVQTQTHAQPKSPLKSHPQLNLQRQTELPLTATFGGGTPGTAATATWTIDGVDLTLAADAPGAAGNATDFELIPTDAAVPGTDLAVSGDTPVVAQTSGTTVQVYARPGVATHADVAAAIDAIDGVSAALAGPSGAIDLYATTTEGGSAATAATASLTIEGEAIDITAASPGAARNGQVIAVLGTAEGDNGTGAGTPVAVSQDGDRLSVFAVSTTATHQDVVDAIDALSGWSATLAPGSVSQTLVLAEADFSVGWTKQGDTSGNWVVNGTRVEQTVNGNATYFIQDTTTPAVTLSSILTTTNFDDDDIGLVVGWTDANNHIVFRWSGGGLQGLAGTQRSLEIKNATDGDQSLASDEVTWVRDQSYEVSVEYAPDNITVRVDGAVVFDVDVDNVAGVSSFPAGQYGLFNQSQPDTTYESLRTGAAAITQGGQDAQTSEATLTVPTAAGSATLAIDGPAAASEVVLDAAQASASVVHDTDRDALVVAVPPDTTVGEWQALIDGAADFSATLNAGVTSDTLALIRRASLAGGTDPTPATVSLPLASGRVVLSDNDIARNGTVVEVMAGCTRQVTEADGRLSVTLRPGVDGFNDLAALINDSGVGVVATFEPGEAGPDDPLLAASGALDCSSLDDAGAGEGSDAGDASPTADALEPEAGHQAVHSVPMASPSGLGVLILVLLAMGLWVRPTHR